MTSSLREYVSGPLSTETNGATAIRFSVLRWAAWAPGRETQAAWCQWAGSEAPADDYAALPQALPMMLRRRLSPFAQRLVSVINACALRLPPSRFVLSTRHGELARALNVLKDIEAETLPSPTDFSMSIHHALLGLLSIHSDNRLGHTALSAGSSSFGVGLMEAATCVAERPDENVIFVHADDQLPESYAAFREADDADLPLVVALGLGPPIGVPHDDISLQLAPRTANKTPSLSLATDFLRFFLSKARTARSVDKRSDWIWRRDT